MTQKIKWTEDLMVDLGSRYASGTHAAASLGIAGNTFYKQLQKPHFKKAWERGKANFNACIIPRVNPALPLKGEKLAPKPVLPADLKQEAAKPAKNEFSEKIQANDRKVLSAIRLGANLINQICAKSKLKKSDVTLAIDRLSFAGAINTKVTPKFTAYFPKESTPDGALFLSTTRVVAVGGDFSEIPPYFCQTCGHSTSSHYQFNSAMPCCVKGCKCRGCVSELADLNREFRERKNFVDNPNPEFIGGK